MVVSMVEFMRGMCIADKQTLVRHCVVYQNTKSIQERIGCGNTLKVEYKYLAKELE